MFDRLSGQMISQFASNREVGQILLYIRETANTTPKLRLLNNTQVQFLSVPDNPMWYLTARCLTYILQMACSFSASAAP